MPVDTMSPRDDDLEKPKVVGEEVIHHHPEVYAEALAKYPDEESIDQAAERWLLRKLDMCIFAASGHLLFLLLSNHMR